jgi:CBS domain-containing protein
MRLQEIMNTRVLSVGSQDEATFAWSRMQRRRIRHLVVVDGDRLVGVLSDRDLGGRDGAVLRRGRVVADLMSSRVVSGHPTMTLRQAANLMRGRRISCLPVLDEDRLVGIVTASDLLEELGRGSTRPKIQAVRRTLRLPAGSKQLGGRPVVRRRSHARAKTGRARHRKPDSGKRAPFARDIPRAAKRQSGTEPQNTPAHIRVLGVRLAPEQRTYLRRKLGMKLGKFASAVERASVRVEDVNGPRGGIDQVCRIKVVLSHLPSVVVEKRDSSLDAAMDGALAGVERAVRRSVQRTRARG